MDLTVHLFIQPFYFAQYKWERVQLNVQLAWRAGWRASL